MRYMRYTCVTHAVAPRLPHIVTLYVWIHAHALIAHLYRLMCGHMHVITTPVYRFMCESARVCLGLRVCDHVLFAHLCNHLSRRNSIAVVSIDVIPPLPSQLFNMCCVLRRHRVQLDLLSFLDLDRITCTELELFLFT